MSPATLVEHARRAELIEQQLGTVRLDGCSPLAGLDLQRQANGECGRRSPRPGSEKVIRLIGAFGAAEGFDVIGPLIADFEESFVKRPRRERIPLAHLSQRT